MPLTRAKAALGVAGAIIGVVAGGWGLWEKIDSKLEQNKQEEIKQLKIMVDQKIHEYYDQKKGSLSHSLSEQTNIARERIPEAYGTLYLDFYKIYPSIKDESHITDVGIKRDSETGDIFYIHTDGKRKNVYYDQTNDWYYFMDSDGTRRTCK
jgi:hypothetical protein